MLNPLPQPPSLPHDTECGSLGPDSQQHSSTSSNNIPEEMATAKTPSGDAGSPPSPGQAAPVMEPVGPSNEPLDPPIDRYDPRNWAMFTPATRRDKHLERARILLSEWRDNTWLAHYKSQPFGPPGILPDTVLTALATRTSYRALEDIRDLRWILAKRHATEVLKLLENLDREVALDDMREEKSKREAEDIRKKAREDEREHERIRKVLEAAKKREEAAVRKAAEEARKTRLRAIKEAAKLIGRRQKEVRAEETKARKRAGKEAEKSVLVLILVLVLAPSNVLVSRTA
ncbi:hypothetical protein DICSQDRAFT_170794 [Dichomitus squalens LYAD-421 SS1]|uniref:Uncharacterized protein n=2 Tax=Dichomitus squalens TaxID=114155 RepID=A0A4Q9P9Q7_9APHY|nr:uncharacterized protein DICSQDRAFT_170794 [Dichomitus squalens LYAD-421 SS1]EJF60636.1 hypothetical protein DICSQDRAFT_170794 [Dichomitus squalens LYAD-421 SS1]TBU51095.1 hypothetical protein BD310DRAFT_835353 [Dichomitus squalens]TBU51354.1 hypothetical protein BD310DRAFT_834556 [Dichomitus squalens]